MPNPADLVVVVGAFTIDDVVLPDGTTHMATLGGNCVYSATAVVAGGASAAVVARRGQDFPVEALAALADAGIDVSKIVDIPGPTQRNWIIYESDGRRSWVYRTTPDRFEAATPQLSDLDAGQLDDARVVHVTALALASSEAIVAHIRRRAPAAIITLDTHEDWVAALSPRVLRLAHQVDVFVPSLEELLALTGATEPVDALQDLAAAGLGRVVLKAGARGAYVLDGDVITHVAALETTVADTTGAGDTFCGGLAAGLARGLGLVEAVALGSAVAGTAITGVGSLRLFEVGRNRDAIRAAGRGLAAAATFVGTARRNQRSARPEPRAASDPPGAGSLAALPDLVSDVLDDVDGRLRALAQRFTDAGTRHLWLSGSGLSTVAASAVSLAFLEHTYVTPHPIRATDLAAYYSPYLPATDAVLSLSADVAGARGETRLFDPAVPSGPAGYLTMLATLLTLARHLGELGRGTAALGSGLARLPSQVAATLQAVDDVASDVAGLLRSASPLVMLGAGPHEATARFGAATLRWERSALGVAAHLDEWESVVGGGGQPVVMVNPTGAGRDHGTAVAAELAALGAPLVLVSDRPVPAPVDGWVLPLTPGVPEALSPVTAGVALAAVAARLGGPLS
jgi:sugar/nucleoside kinase (ribokinase family)